MNCPFYEEHAGVYYQGCWEFVDLCELAPQLNTNPRCHEGCFLKTLNEREMLSIFFKAYNGTREVWQFKKPPVQRPLTLTEKSGIIRDMETCFDYINKKSKKNLPYI